MRLCFVRTVTVLPVEVPLPLRCGAPHSVSAACSAISTWRRVMGGEGRWRRAGWGLAIRAVRRGGGGGVGGVGGVGGGGGVVVGTEAAEWGRPRVLRRMRI